MTDAVSRLSSALADRYVIERELGAGGMATVYLAHDVRHDRKVALKVLRPELAAILGGERFLQEIRTTANLQHPHILPLFDSGIGGSGDRGSEFVYYVMPYVDGESLRDRLAREKQLPMDDAVRIAREVADALDYAHQHGVVHRDIKPENILLHGGHAMVADFGIALAVSTVGGGTRMTETGMSLGTPHYMAPEQAMGDREITPRVDIYAIGCVTYEMLTGDPPFTGSTAQAIVARVVTDNPRSLTSQRHTIAPHVEAAVLKALEKLPADRFASAAEFGAALANPAFTAATTMATAAAGRRDWRSKLALPMTVVAAVALVLAGWALTRPAPPAAPVARFTVPLPGAAAAGTFAPVLSPDGSKLLFIALDSQRTPRVYLRYLDRELPVPVPGTEGTLNSAYFSYDGQWIVFRQAGKLRKVAVVGGASLVICDLVGGFTGVSWSSRDEIVVGTNDTLYRVAAAGGQRTMLLAPDTASGTQRYQSPHFLPDGRSFVAVRLTRAGPLLVVVDLETARVRELGISGVTPTYIDDGRLVYADVAGTLLAAPFDARRGRVTGAAEPLAENVNVAQGVFGRFSASRSGAIAYFTGGVGDLRELVLVGRDGRSQPLAAPAGAYRYPRFSPDGRRIAVGIEGAGRTLIGDIWTFDLASRRLTRLTSDTASLHPEWTPDGRAIVYTRIAAGAFGLYRVAADGSADPVAFFSRQPGSVFESRLLSDGRHLVFREDVAAGIRDILVAPVDSPAAARALAATGFNERGIALTPDGRWLAFVSNLSGANEVYIRRLEEGSPRWRVSTGGGTEPRWGPGGREVFYRSGDSLYVVPVGLGPEPRLGEPRALFGGSFTTSFNEVLYDISPDGRQFVMVRSPGGTQPGSTLHLILNHFDQPRARTRP
jgi:Tol biopolymer transport system component